jgi:hypothetical protein
MLKSWACSICGMQAPKELREHGKFNDRMRWLRGHYKLYHPDEFRRMYERMVETKKERLE